MRRTPRISVDLVFALRGLGLFALFVGGAWTTLMATSGTRAGLVLGPLAAQGTMAVVILLGSRMALRWEAAPCQRPPRRRVSLVPLVFVACGGFLLQAAFLAGGRLFLTASIPASGSTTPFPVTWVVMLVSSVVAAPLLEEVFFRGMLQPLLSRRNVTLGLVTTAALFGLAHGFGMPLRMLPAFLQGLVLGAVTLLTGRLRGAMLVHALNNALVLAAATMVALHPQALAAGAHDGQRPWPLAAYALVGLGLLGWGFYRIVREPQILRDSPAVSA